MADPSTPSTNKDLGQKDFLELYAMRKAAGRNDKLSQNILAPYEHQAMVRESVADDPYKALSHLVTAPVYQAAKILSQTDSRSDPSLDQLFYAWKGIVEGLEVRRNSTKNILEFLGVTDK